MAVGWLRSASSLSGDGRREDAISPVGAPHMAEDRTTQVVIIGGGPAGSAVALQLLDRGITPIIVEREQFPRFHIGESMTGECGGIVRRLGFEEQMKTAEHPVKHGVTVFGTRGNPDWWIPMSRRDDQGLHNHPTWQVRRSTFDKMLLDAAVERGAELVHGRVTDPIVDDGVVTGRGGGDRRRHHHHHRRRAHPRLLRPGQLPGQQEGDRPQVPRVVRQADRHVLPDHRLRAGPRRGLQRAAGQHPHLLHQEVPLGVGDPHRGRA